MEHLLITTVHILPWKTSYAYKTCIKKRTRTKPKPHTGNVGRLFHSYMGRSITAQAHGLHGWTVRSHPYNKGLQLLSPFCWMKGEEFSWHTPVTNAWSARRNLSSISLWATSHHLFLGTESYEVFLVNSSQIQRTGQTSAATKHTWSLLQRPHISPLTSQPLHTLQLNWKVTWDVTEVEHQIVTSSRQWCRICS